MRIWRIILLVAVASTAVGGSAAADDKDAARREYLEGTRRYDLNEFAPALEAFKRAYLAYEDPAFLYNIAQCYRQLGKKTDAIQFYRSYLRKVPDAPNRDEVTATIANLDAAIAAEKATTPPPAKLETPPSATPSTAAPNQLVVTTQPSKPHTPVYKKWWLWTVVGVVAAGAAAGAAIAVTSQKTEGSLMPVTVTQ